MALILGFRPRPGVDINDGRALCGLHTSLPYTSIESPPASWYICARKHYFVTADGPVLDSGCHALAAGRFVLLHWSSAEALGSRGRQKLGFFPRGKARTVLSTYKKMME